MRAYEVIGDIAIISLPFPDKKKEKKARILARKILKRSNIKRVVLKISKIKGKLRKSKFKIIAGEGKNLETIHIESGLRLKLDIEKTYFSPRLSNERLEIAKIISKKSKGKKKKILVMFSGICPYALIISKLNPKSEVKAIEINREASRYASENVSLNKIRNLEIIQGDVSRISKNIARKKEKFDFIVMPRPKLEKTFLDSAFPLTKKESRIFYYDFVKEDKIKNIENKVKKEAKKNRKKIKILKIKKAGEISPYKFRIRVEFKILK